MDGDTIMQDVLKKGEFCSGDDEPVSKSGWLVVKSVALTVQLLGCFKVRWGIEIIRPFGVLTTDAQGVPICLKCKI